jgi:putative peptidoglycan lipid II flippase
VLAGIALLAGLSAPVYLTALAPGFSIAERRLAQQLAHLMLPAIVLQGLVVLSGAILQVHRRFVRPALATAVYNVTFCLALLFLPLRPATTRAGWAVLLGAAAGLLFQITLLWKHRPIASPQSTQRPCGGGDDHDRDTTREYLSRLTRLSGSMTAGYAVHHAILFADRAMATALGAGRAATLHYAYHLALIVGQTSGLAVSTALFPRLAEQTAAGDHAGMRAAVADALHFVLLVGLPASSALVLLRTPAIEFLLQGGAFEATAVEAVTHPLTWYALGVLMDALCQPLWRVVYVRQRPQTVLAINGAQTVVRLICNIALIPAMGYNGIALSAAIGLTLQAGILGWWAWRQIGAYLTSSWLGDAGRIALATAVAAGATSLAISQLETAPPLLILSIGGLSGGLVYLIVLRALGLRILQHVQVTLPHPE